MGCLLVSGYAETDPDEVGHCPVLPKPFTQAELAAALRKIAASRDAHPSAKNG